MTRRILWASLCSRNFTRCRDATSPRTRISLHYGMATSMKKNKKRWTLVLLAMLSTAALAFMADPYLLGLRIYRYEPDLADRWIGTLQVPRSRSTCRMAASGIRASMIRRSRCISISSLELINEHNIGVDFPACAISSTITCGGSIRVRESGRNRQTPATPGVS